MSECTCTLSAEHFDRGCPIHGESVHVTLTCHRDFIGGESLNVIQPALAEKLLGRPRYKCLDCGHLQSSESPYDDCCDECEGTNCQYLGRWSDEIDAELKAVAWETSKTMGDVELVKPPMDAQHWQWFESVYIVGDAKSRGSAVDSLVAKAKELKLSVFADQSRIKSWSQMPEFTCGPIRATFRREMKGLPPSASGTPATEDTISLDWIGR